MVPSFVPMAIFRPSLVVEHHYLRPWSPPKDEGALALLGGEIKTRTAVQATIKYWYESGCVYKFDRGARQTSGLSSNDHIENPISCPPRTAGSGKGCRPPLQTEGSLSTLYHRYQLSQLTGMGANHDVVHAVYHN